MIVAFSRLTHLLLEINFFENMDGRRRTSDRPLATNISLEPAAQVSLKKGPVDDATYEGHSISNQPTLLSIEIGRFLFIKLISSKILFDFMFEKKILSNNS